MDDEVFISGFCRRINDTRTVCAEYEKTPDGISLTGVDCSYFQCEHRGSCEVARQMEAKTQE